MDCSALDSDKSNPTIHSSQSSYPVEPEGQDTRAFDLALLFTYAWFFPSMCLTGAVANGCSFWVILKNRRSFTRVTRQYLLIITANDFLALTVNGSLLYLYQLASPAVFPDSLTIFFNFSSAYATVGAHFFQLGLTVDRLVAVAAPMRARQILTRRRSRILLATITLTSLTLPVLSVGLYFACKRLYKCDLFYAMVTIYLPAELYFGRIFLLVAMSLGTVSICVCIRRSSLAARKISQRLPINHRSLVRVSLMLVFINALFIVTCGISSVAVAVLFKLHIIRGCVEPSTKFWLKIEVLDNLVYLNNALSWLVYFMGAKFRRAFIATIRLDRCRCLCCSAQPTEVALSS